MKSPRPVEAQISDICVVFFLQDRVSFSAEGIYGPYLLRLLPDMRGQLDVF